MAQRKFRVGEKASVIGLPKITYAPGVVDELGTEKLFRSMLGRVYIVRGFDKSGNIELQPTRSDKVWIEPKFLKLRERRKSKPKSK